MKKIWEACTNTLKITASWLSLFVNILPGLIIYILQMIIGITIAIVTLRIAMTTSADIIELSITLIMLVAALIGILYSHRSGEEKPPDRGG